jgi:hypothetical protein
MGTAGRLVRLLGAGVCTHTTRWLCRPQRAARISGQRAVLIVFLHPTRGRGGRSPLTGVPRLGRSRPTRAAVRVLRKRAGASSLKRAEPRLPLLMGHVWAQFPLDVAVLRRGRACLELVERARRRRVARRERSRRAVLQHVRRQVAPRHKILRGEAAGGHQNLFLLSRRRLRLRRRAVRLLASPVWEAAAIAVSAIVGRVRARVGASGLHQSWLESASHRPEVLRLDVLSPSCSLNIYVL